MAKPPVRRPHQVTPTPQPRNVMTAVRQYSGPLPEPQDLARYEELLPGAAERIIAMAEAEQQHRTSMERSALASDQAHREMVTAEQAKNARSIFRSDMVGQLLGGVIALSCVAGGIFSVYVGANWAVAVAFVGLPVIGIIKAVRHINKPNGK